MFVAIAVGMVIGLTAVRTIHKCEGESTSARIAVEIIIGMIVLIEEMCVLIMFVIGWIVEME